MSHSWKFLYTVLQLSLNYYIKNFWPQHKCVSHFKPAPAYCRVRKKNNYFQIFEFFFLKIILHKIEANVTSITKCCYWFGKWGVVVTSICILNVLVKVYKSVYICVWCVCVCMLIRVHLTCCLTTAEQNRGDCCSMRSFIPMHVTDWRTDRGTDGQTNKTDRYV